MSIGIASFLMLGVLLFVSALARARRTRKQRRYWLVAAGTLLLVVAVALPWYRLNLATLTFTFPSPDSPHSFVRGTQLSAQGEAYWARNPQKLVHEVVADFGGPEFRARVWTEASIQRASTILGVHYLVIVLGLASAIFCLTEGLAVGSTPPSRKKPQPPQQ
jgi:4-amino-4-deoxy-L-arabinose transferase-like glycosyltransferase